MYVELQEPICKENVKANMHSNIKAENLLYVLPEFFYYERHIHVRTYIGVLARRDNFLLQFPVFILNSWPTVLACSQVYQFFCNSESIIMADLFYYTALAIFYLVIYAVKINF